MIGSLGIGNIDMQKPHFQWVSLEFVVPKWCKSSPSVSIHSSFWNWKSLYWLFNVLRKTKKLPANSAKPWRFLLLNRIKSAINHHRSHSLVLCHWKSDICERLVKIAVKGLVVIISQWDPRPTFLAHTDALRPKLRFFDLKWDIEKHWWLTVLWWIDVNQQWDMNHI